MASNEATQTSVPTTSAGFFQRNAAPPAEVVEGMIRAGQIVAFAGPYGIGKSPLLAHLAICILNGLSWCGRNVARRPVVHFDFESNAPACRRTLQNIANRFKVDVPSVPEELDVYLQNDDVKEPSTAKLLDALKSPHLNVRFALIEEALKAKPDAVVIVDPMELLFRIDTRDKVHVLVLYSGLRFLLSQYPKAVTILTFNLRKKDRRSQRVDLLFDPREWLEEVCGSLDVMNRSDVRWGMDFHGDETRVINGIRRGEDMHPLLIRPVGVPPDTLAGFELVRPDELDLIAALTPAQMEHWQKLPDQFRFSEAVALVPKASLWRLLERARSLGVIEEQGGVYRKRTLPA
jgi:KaiC/GvpD/RAD55 family RecA-like ATPase